MHECGGERVGSVRRAASVCLGLVALLSVACESAASASAVPQVSISARSFVAIDADSGRVLLAHASTVRRPIASLTKVMTVLLVIERGHLQVRLRDPRRDVGRTGARGADRGPELLPHDSALVLTTRIEQRFRHGPGDRRGRWFTRPVLQNDEHQGAFTRDGADNVRQCLRAQRHQQPLHCARPGKPRLELLSPTRHSPISSLLASAARVGRHPCTPRCG